jgi:hypothetical protein
MNKKSEDLVDELFSEIECSPTGELSLPLRRFLWKVVTEGQSAIDKKITLTKLDSACVRYGASIWSRKFGNAEELEKILEVADKVARGEISEEEGLAIRDDFYVEVVEDREYEPEEYPAMFVGHAAANTIVTAADEFNFTSDDQENDYELDPDAFEPSYLVASAFAKGLAEDGDPGSRRQFWKWYLSTALHEALQGFSEH